MTAAAEVVNDGGHGTDSGRLTAKVRGHAGAPEGIRARTISPGSRSASQIAHHGPLERSLEAVLAIRTHMFDGRMDRSQSKSNFSGGS